MNIHEKSDSSDSMKVLYAEDDLAHVALTRRMFENLGLDWPIMHFSNGELLLNYLVQIADEGKDSLENILLLIDLKMPVMNGIETLEKVKNDSRLKKIPAIIFTTSTTKKDIQRCYEIGCDGYFEKTFSGVETRKFLELVRSVTS